MIKNILGKIADRKLESLGFKKIVDSEYCAGYERHNERYGYTHKLDILRKANGPAIIQSYDPELIDERGVGCTCVGITREEATAAAMKIISKGW